MILTVYFFSGYRWDNSWPLWQTSPHERCNSSECMF